MRRHAFLILTAFCLLPACGCGRNGGGGEAQASREEARPAISAREMEDAADAIEKFLQVGRTREAELLARKLRDSVRDGDSARTRVAELASRAFFAHAELAKRGLEPRDRDALIEEASVEAARAAESEPPDPIRLRFAALLAGRSGDAAAANRFYDRALAVAPKDLQTLAAAATLAIGSRDLSRAETLVARHAELAPEEAWSAALEAQLALARNDAPRAIERANAAISRDRDALEFRILFARALGAAGRAGDAARALSALPPEQRAKIPVAQAFAEALRASGDLAGAARAWDAAVDLAPEDPFARAELALALFRAGDQVRAAAALEALRALAGGASEVARVERALRDGSGSDDGAPKPR